MCLFAISRARRGGERKLLFQSIYMQIEALGVTSLRLDLQAEIVRVIFGD